MTFIQLIFFVSRETLRASDSERNFVTDNDGTDFGVDAPPLVVCREGEL